MNGFGVGNSKASCGKFVIVPFILMNDTPRKRELTGKIKIDTKTFLPLDIGIGMGILI